MFTERTGVGLDVHERSVVAAAIDGRTGEVGQQRLGTSDEELLAWLARLSGPISAVYEAGRPGSGSRDG